jgi:hypothetical protein
VATRVPVASVAAKPSRIGTEALASAVAEARAEELQDLAEDLKQLELFDVAGSVQEAQAPVVNGHRGPGRPAGSRNRRTDEASRFYMPCKGDPLLFGVEISALPILRGTVLPSSPKSSG